MDGGESNSEMDYPCFASAIVKDGFKVSEPEAKQLFNEFRIAGSSGKNRSESLCEHLVYILRKENAYPEHHLRRAQSLLVVPKPRGSPQVAPGRNGLSSVLAFVALWWRKTDSFVLGESGNGISR